MRDMIFINEWLPNPVGNDNAGEFIELYNSGATAANLSGYTLSDGAKKKFSLGGHSIPARGYLLLKKVETKLSLKNTDGGLLLYGPDSRAVDGAYFIGPAPEGKSFSRANYNTASTAHFTFTYPTPGAVNRTIDTAVAVRAYPTGISLAPSITLPAFILMTFGTAAFFLVFFIYVTRNNRNISNFFFGRDEKAGI